jgi:predicted TPR repeat methyltransferase
MTDISMPGIVDLYTELADRYDHLVVTSRYVGPQWLSERMAPYQGRSFNLLDLGCANGHHVRAIKQVNPSVSATGVDITPKMLEIAQATGLYDRLHLHDLNRPLDVLPANTFDVVLALSFLEFIERIEVCLAEMSRVLKPGGDLFASFQHALPAHEHTPPTPASGSIKFWAYSSAEVEQMLHHVGLEIRSFEACIGYTSRAGLDYPYLMVHAYKPV